MARSSEPTRQRVLEAAYELFYRHGFSRVGVDQIAEQAGITKRTLYNHFESKDTLVAAVLDHQHLHALAQIQGWGVRSAENSSEFLASIFQELGKWASRPRWLGSGFTRLTMELADLPGHPARRAAHLHKTEVENWLAQELDTLGAEDPKELARQTMLLIEGCLSLILIHGDRSYAAAAKRAACELTICGSS
jgi:AcrR family transcriptional regulator